MNRSLARLVLLWHWFRSFPFCKFLVDPHSLACLADSPSIQMQANEKVYGFTISLYEYRRTVETLWDATREFARLHPEYIHPDNAIGFLVDDQDKGLMDGEWNNCHFWSNFEIADLRFLRSKPYLDYFNFLDQKGGFFYEVSFSLISSSFPRAEAESSWADEWFFFFCRDGEMHQFIQSLSPFSYRKIRLFISILSVIGKLYSPLLECVYEVDHFRSPTRSHNPYTACPASPKLRKEGVCECEQKNSFNRVDGYSCQPWVRDSLYLCEKPWADSDCSFFSPDAGGN